MKRHTVFVGMILLSAFLFSGCSTVILFDPRGPVGESERFVIFTAAVLMAIIVIPVFVMSVWIPWKYRASNANSKYQPKWSHSTKLELFMWVGPIIIVSLLAILAWNRTHSLDPYKSIPSAAQPLNIEVVCLDWKWLFIYPDQGIATVNQITFPANVPLYFHITSDTVMGSFFIPQLGSQIYAMAGMHTHLYLMADKAGTYSGHNQQLTGRGYAGMLFQAKAVSPQEFQTWVQKVRQSQEKLDPARYEQLAKPSVVNPVIFFSVVKPGLFEDIMRKYHPTPGNNTGPVRKEPVSASAGTAVPEGE